MARRKVMIQDEFERCDGPTWRLRRAFPTLTQARTGAKRIAEKFMLHAVDFEYDHDEILVVTDNKANVQSGWVATYMGDIPSQYCAHPPKRHYSWYARDDLAKSKRILCVVCSDCGAALAGGA